jgi:hypothetical protein
LAKFPAPPPAHQLAELPPVIHTLPQGTRLWRIYFGGGAHPVSWNTFRHYGPTNSRFDHHLLPKGVQDRGILYAAIKGNTAFAEVFQETRVIDRRRGAPFLAGFDLGAPVTLLDLRGKWPTRAKASMAINSGPRPRARRWSREIYEAYPDIHGLWYASSMDANEPAVALYERAVHAMPLRPVFHQSLADPALTRIVVRAAARFGYLVV